MGSNFFIGKLILFKKMTTLLQILPKFLVNACKKRNKEERRKPELVVAAKWVDNKNYI